MTQLLMAFTLGLLSAPHCIAMCGPVASTLLLAGRAPDETQALRWHSAAPALPLQGSARAEHALFDALALGGGKMLTYAGLGALAGAGSALLHSFGSEPATVLRLLAAVLMIGIGLYIAGWWRGLARLEAWGARLWRPTLSLLRRLPSSGTGGRLLAGASWGLLPCGIVYSMLGLALASGSAVQGAALMASFGLGTLPFVLLTGGLMQTLGQRLAAPGVRTAAGLAMIAMGVVSLLFLTGLSVGTGMSHTAH